MKNFADRLIEAIQQKGNPCVVGLDPRVHLMPYFIIEKARSLAKNEDQLIRRCITEYHRRIIRLVADFVPAVKPQIAFYEQYGIPGLMAFEDTIKEAKNYRLQVIVDAKRNDIASTAQAYANAFLGRTPIFGKYLPVYDVDCITVSPFLGRDSIEPFVKTCQDYGKGIFILIKTSNPGSADLQNLMLSVEGKSIPLYIKLTELVNKYAIDSIGDCGYSSIGAVVGATFPAEAQVLREMMQQSIFLVPGYGAQGGSAQDAAFCFNKDGLGAVVNASRSISYNFESLDLGENEFDQIITNRVKSMIKSINTAIEDRIARSC